MVKRIFIDIIQITIIGICILINDIPATFSIITFDGNLPLNVFSIQIQDNPPDDYLFVNDSVSLENLLILLRRFTANIGEWP